MPHCPSWLFSLSLGTTPVKLPLPLASRPLWLLGGRCRRHETREDGWEFMPHALLTMAPLPAATSPPRLQLPLVSTLSPHHPTGQLPPLESQGGLQGGQRTLLLLSLQPSWQHVLLLLIPGLPQCTLRAASTTPTSSEESRLAPHPFNVDGSADSVGLERF